MSDDAKQREGTEAGEEQSAPKPSPIEKLKALKEKLPKLQPSRGRLDAWQLPAAIAGLALVGAGVMAWVKGAEPPDFDAALDSVEAMLVQQQYDEAIAYLNHPIGSSFTAADVSGESYARFNAVSADAISMTQAARGLDVRSNHQKIIELYQEAEAGDPAAITDLRRARWASSEFVLRNYVGALEHARKISPERSDLKLRLLKRVAEDAVSRPGGLNLGTDSAATLLREIRADPSVDVSDRLWAARNEAELRLRAGYPERAIEHLMPELHRLTSRTSPDAGRLFVLLGRAYKDLGQTDAARKQFERALAKGVLSGADPDVGIARYHLARIDQQAGELDDAMDGYRAVAETFPQTPVAAAAHIGLGETFGVRGDVAQSLRSYERGVLAVATRNMEGVTTKEDVSESLTRQHADQTSVRNYSQALRFATLEARLYPSDALPAELLARLSATHRSVASKIMETVPLTPSGQPDLRAVDPVTLEEARQHFYQAGKRAAQNARAVQMGDMNAYAEAIWAAGEAYDHAGASDLASEMFAEYIEIRLDDPRALEAKHMLGKTYLAGGQYQLAITMFQDLIQNNPTSKPAVDSYVPLAEAYLASSSDQNWQPAEALLMRALRGGDGDLAPDAGDYRAALIRLGMMYRRVGEHNEAITRLQEAMDRYPDLRDKPRMVASLADAYRLSATSITERLAKPMPPSERHELRAKRAERLAKSLDLYEQVRTSLLAKDSRRMNDLDKVLLRNALFYRADCVFDLAKVSQEDSKEGWEDLYRKAVKYYDTAAQRYSGEPSSLVAMSQIVSCYAALGQIRQAQIAQERARARLAELPDDAWRGLQDIPMDRRHWERWLESSLLVEAAQATAQENAGG